MLTTPAFHISTDTLRLALTRQAVWQATHSVADGFRTHRHKLAAHRRNVDDYAAVSEWVTVHVDRVGLLRTQLQDALPQSTVLSFQVLHLVLQQLRVLCFTRARPSGALPVLHLQQAPPDPLTCKVAPGITLRMPQTQSYAGAETIAVFWSLMTFELTLN